MYNTSPLVSQQSHVNTHNKDIHHLQIALAENAKLWTNADTT